MTIIILILIIVIIILVIKLKEKPEISIVDYKNDGNEKILKEDED